jgi:orotidine-5'-phosphate decarboxylase
MQYQQLVNQIKKKRSFLCVGLDSDINKLPACVLDEAFPVFAFNKTIIDAT